MLLLLTSCVQEEFDIPQVDSVPEGYTKITFGANILAPTVVDTRAVDPDGLDVNNMTLFCFNEFGLYISSEEATIVPGSKTEDGISEHGEYTAVVPNHTRIIHFLANHSKGLYDDSNFPGQTESMVVANMEGGSGMLVYWSRFEMDTTSDKSIDDQLHELTYKIGNTTYNGIKLIRNQAKVTVENQVTNRFVVTGFRTVNIPAFGTVAPHHPSLKFDLVDNWEQTEEFVTLPNNQALMSDISDINTKPADYIFESENSGDKLISVIIKGHANGETEADDKYYRVVMQNSDGSNFMIRRNHHYNVKITGMLTFGQDNFEDALTAAASNNAWISIDEWVNEISDGVESLWVEQTSYVLSSDTYAGTDWTIPYKYTKNGQGDSTAPTVTWIDNNVAYNNITNSYNKTSGEGSITLPFYPMYEGNEQQVGSLLIKHGKLQRKITIYVIRTQKFTPSWVSSQVFGVAHENVTVMFTIPDTCPEALFPFTVLVSVNHLDVRSTSGQQLPIYVKGEEGYFGTDWDGINYKYAYTVTGPGKHRLHMHSILKHEEDDIESIHLEAEFFETITKNVIFRGYNNAHRRIFLERLMEYESIYAQDEHLYYLLVPQKKAAPVVLKIKLEERKSDNTYVAYNHLAGGEGEEWQKNGKDEFVIYSKALSMYDDYFAENPGQYEEIKDVAWEGEVMITGQDTWDTSGRFMAFRPYGYKENDGYKYGLQEDGSYNIYMLTNSTNSKDVVRIASNTSHNPHLFEYSRTGEKYDHEYYDGNEYRSVIFDVTHYRPYRFAAQVKISDGNTSTTIPADNELLSNQVHGSQEENVDDIMFSYKPGQQVDIMLDVTSFQGSDSRSTHPFGEYFGSEFDINIDAPMLEIDYDRIEPEWLAKNNSELNGVDKLRKHPTIPGRFIYTVDRHREKEREYGYAEAHNKDLANEKFDQYGRIEKNVTIDQTGERKLLPFKKTAITVGGDIVISSDTDKVVFWEKRFSVDTKHITGEIYYQKDGKQQPLPKDAFVAFVRLRTGARIGVCSIVENGKFELNLRDEYQFAWEDDYIDLYYTVGDVTYNFNYTENGETKSVDLNTLYKLVERGEPIVLTQK